MLVSLTLKNIALIQSLELSFKKGFTVFTGQTGAGKSIFLESLNLLFAPKNLASQNRLIRSGADIALIEASFNASESILSWLNNEEIDIDDDLVITREWRLKDGKYKSRFRINGILVNRQQITSIRHMLIDFTLQGDSYFIIESSNQIKLLDRLGSVNINQLSIKVEESWKEWHRSWLDLNLYEEKKKKSDFSKEELNSMLDELKNANLHDPDEIQNLILKQDRLVNGVSLSESISLILNILNKDASDYPNVYDQLSLSINELNKASRLDNSLTSISDKIIDISSELQSVIKELDDYFINLDSDSELLDQLQSRLSFLKMLERKYGLTLLELIEKRDSIEELISSDGIDHTLEKLIMLEKSRRSKRDKYNDQLSKMRRKIAKQFEEQLIINLEPLELNNIDFKIKFDEIPPTINGIDKIEFLFSTNPGSPLSPLSQISSGGEKSRFLLAMKAIFASLETSGTLIFDEIDSGVSGQVSTAIANVLKNLSHSHQVFCVTHQPLVAAVGDHHFSVQKTIDSGISKTKVVELIDLESRKLELAALAGGPNSQSTAYAASLLEQHAA